MIGNGIALLGLIALTGLGVWIVRHAWRAKRAIVKWPGVLLAGLLTVLCALCVVLAGKGFAQFYLPGGGPITALTVAGTPAQIARGQHLADSLCASCHTSDGKLPLSGGRDIGADSPLPIGSYWSINLTPAGPLKSWSDGDIMRALREGIDRDGHPLLVMSTNAVRHLSDDDKLAVIAYLRAQPPAVKETGNPPDQPNLLIAIMTGAGITQPQSPVGSVDGPLRGETIEYGKYIVTYHDCYGCHGADLSGGTDPIGPHGPNLRVVQGWTREQFMATLRSGKDPGGHRLADVMPWRYIGRMDDDELGAVYAYLRSLPPAPAR